MEWISTTGKTTEEATRRAIDLLSGGDPESVEVQVVNEASTGLFGRTKGEARVRARLTGSFGHILEQDELHGEDEPNDAAAGAFADWTWLCPICYATLTLVASHDVPSLVVMTHAIEHVTSSDGHANWECGDPCPVGWRANDPDMSTASAGAALGYHWSNECEYFHVTPSYSHRGLETLTVNASAAAGAAAAAAIVLLRQDSATSFSVASAAHLAAMNAFAPQGADFDHTLAAGEAAKSEADKGHPDDDNLQSVMFAAVGAAEAIGLVGSDSHAEAVVATCTAAAAATTSIGGLGPKMAGDVARSAARLGILAADIPDDSAFVNAALEAVATSAAETYGRSMDAAAAHAIPAVRGAR